MSKSSTTNSSKWLQRLEGQVAKRLLRLPPALIASLLGKRRRVIRGVALDPTAQLALELFKLTRRPPLDQLGPQAARVEFAKLLPISDVAPRPLLQVTDRSIPGPAGDIAIRVYRDRPGVVPGLLYVHGGGFVVGNLDTHDPPLREVCHQAGCAIVAVDYRLAPEHPFPAALDDAAAAWSWLQAHAAELEIDPQRVALGGDSAGGNLTAALCQMLRDGGHKHPAAQVLLYPVTDMLNRAPSRDEYADGLFLERALVDWFTQSYLPSPELKRDPRVSPALARDLRGLPPALVLTCGFDPLQDEGKAYGAQLQEAGVDVEFVHYPEQIHGIFGMGGAIPAGRDAIARVAGFLGRTLATGPN